MGRRKLSMELISKEKSRMLTFKKRKVGLMKKVHELTTLCDISACMIIYGPVQENRVVEPEIWPQNPDEIRRLIDIYKAKSDDSGRSRSSGLSDLFHERERKAEEELAKLRKKNAEAKYPTWDEFLNFLNAAELRALIAVLNQKAEIVKSRIEFLKREKQGSDHMMMNMNMMMMDFAPPDLGQFYPLNLDQEINPVDSVNLCHYSGGGYNQGTAAAAAGDPMICYNHMTMPLQPQIYYAQPMLQPVPPPLLPPHMQWPMIPAVAPPAEMHFYGDEEDDIINYLLLQLS